MLLPMNVQGYKGFQTIFKDKKTVAEKIIKMAVGPKGFEPMTARL